MFTCPHLDCGYTSVSYKNYIQHVWDKHILNSNFKHLCGVSDCTRMYSCKQSFLRHLSAAHNWFYKIHYSVETPCVISEHNSQPEMAEDNDMDVNVDVEMDCNDDVKGVSPFSCEKAKDLVSDFLLELRERFSCTTKATCFVAEKLSHILDMDRRYHSARVMESVKENLGVQLDYVSKTILESESVFYQPFVDFKCEKSLTRYIEKKEMYVAPVSTVVENPDTSEEGTVQYVPLLTTLETILGHQDMLNFVLATKAPSDECLSNYCDGSVYRNNPLFKSDPRALQLILYHDDFQVANPLGNKTVFHKMSGVYMQLANIPFEYRSRLIDIHLVMVYQANMLATFGYKNLLRPLIDDLKVLEEFGVQISLLEQNYVFRGTLVMVIADNLAAHALSGHFCNFSTVQRFCRFCLLMKNDINSTKLNSFDLRTIVDHEQHIKDINVSDDFKSLYGIARDCCFNELKFFHSVTGFPPDFAHDMLEGFCRDVCKLVVFDFVNSKFFSLPTLNEEISAFSYSQCDKSNQPFPFKIKSPLCDTTFKYTACEMWNFVRLLPLMIAKYVPEGNPNWKLYHDFLDLFERLTALRFSQGDISYLSYLLEKFFGDFIKAFPENDLKPKAHFLMHYPMATLRHGPLVKTLRFESKNGFLKGTVKLSKNKKNVAYSMAKRHQMNMYLLYKEEEITERRKPSLIYSKEVSIMDLPYVDRECLIKCGISFDNLDYITSAKAAIAKGHRYGEDEAVILGFDRGEYIFGLIEKVMYIRSTLYIITKSLCCHFNEHYHAYEITSVYEEYTMTAVDDLCDHHPLGVYYVDDILLLTLRYYVSEELISSEL